MDFLRTLMRPVASVAGRHASRQLAVFMEAHANTHEVQNALLAELIEAHSQTGFGRQHGLGSVKGYEDFKAAVPVGNYETLRPYMEQVFQGQSEALLPPGEEPLMFAQTSGTTGKPKQIPVTARFLEDMRRGFNMFGLRVLRDHPAGWLRPIVQISSPMNESESPSGLPCGAISGLLSASQKWIVKRMYVVPQEVSAIRDPETRFYLTLRCGMASDVGIITTANPSSTIKLAETGQKYAERIVRDVADGDVNPPGELPKSLRRELRFRPDRQLAGRMANGIKCDGKLLPKHFWNLAFLTNWTGGTLKLYMPRLRELFGQVPVRDIGLLASEGRFSLPIEDGTAAGLAEITGNFLEFISVEDADEENPPTVRAEEVEVGRDYFLVVTNWAGLWRYNIDDRVRITGFYKKSPIFEFLSRGQNTANITGEKITEHHVVEAMRQAARQANVQIERFVFQGRFSSTPYYELRLPLCQGVDATQLAELMDKALGLVNMEYASKRQSQRLGPIRPVILPKGVLTETEEQIIMRRGGRSEQYKHQYLMTEILADE